MERSRSLRSVYFVAFILSGRRFLEGNCTLITVVKSTCVQGSSWIPAPMTNGWCYTCLCFSNDISICTAHVPLGRQTGSTRCGRGSLLAVVTNSTSTTLTGTATPPTTAITAVPITTTAATPIPITTTGGTTTIPIIIVSPIPIPATLTPGDPNPSTVPTPIPIPSVPVPGSTTTSTTTVSPITIPPVTPIPITPDPGGATIVTPIPIGR